MSQITKPTEFHYLYQIAAGSATYTYNSVDVQQEFDGEQAVPIQVRHELFTNSGEAEDLETDLQIHKSAEVANHFLDGPPPYQVIVTIYEYDRDADTSTPTYLGWVTRSNFELDRHILSLHLKSLWHFFERESLSDSLSALSRYLVYDPRSGVDAESLKETITVTSLNDERDVLTVTGITQPVEWYKGGRMRAQDGDERTIIQDEIVTTDRVFTLSAAFPRFTVSNGFTVEVYPGDDLTYETWANKFAAQTNNGERHGGWQHTPNVDPQVRGVI